MVEVINDAVEVDSQPKVRLVNETISMPARLAGVEHCPVNVVFQNGSNAHCQQLQLQSMGLPSSFNLFNDVTYCLGG